MVNLNITVKFGRKITAYSVQRMRRPESIFTVLLGAGGEKKEAPRAVYPYPSEVARG